MNYWILQSNPVKFRILDWLVMVRNSGDLTDCWHISQFKEEVKPGDVAFIWKSKGNSNIRGIYAKAKVIPKPERFSHEEEERNYWIDKAEEERLARGVKEGKFKWIAIKYEYTTFYLDKPLLSDEIEKIPMLEKLTIIKIPRRGICKMEPEQGKLVESMLG